MKTKPGVETGRGVDFFQRLPGRLPLLFAMLLIALPLALHLLWGGYLPDEAFVLLRQAQRLAGEGWSGRPALVHPPPSEPLLLGLLTISEWLALPSPLLAGLVAAAGWSTAVAVLLRLGWRVGPPHPFLVGALLLALSPLSVTSSVSSSGWAVAICLLLLAPFPGGRWRRRGLLTVGLLLVVIDPATLLVAGLFLLWQWQQQRRLRLGGVRPEGGFGVLLILLVLISSTWYGWQVAAADSATLWTPGRQRPAAWLAVAQDLLRESELYWLFLPALAGGLLTLLTPLLRPVSPGVYKRILLLLLAGAGGLLLASRFAGVLLAVLGLLFVGLGSAGLPAWLQKEERLAVSPRLAIVGSTLLIALPLVAAQAASLWQRYQFRPIAWQEVEREAALWLAAESEPSSTLWSSQRAAYYARRPLVASEEAVLTADRLQEALKPVLEEEPAYVLSDGQLDWDRVTRSNWFQIRYCPIYTASAEDGFRAEPRSPLTVWQFQGESAQETSFGVRTTEGIELVDARVEPRRVEPGDAVTLSLVWKALCPQSGPFEMLIRLTTTLGEPLVEEQFVVPQTIPFSEWQPGRQIEETYTITTGSDLAAGAHLVHLSLNSPGSLGPDWGLYRLQDSRSVHEIIAGYVVRSWQGDMSGATPLAARFGEQIELEGARLEGEAVPGGSLTLELFWHALRQPDDNYTIFVHMLDGQDQLIAGADREPLEGRFPTDTWQAGERVGSEHPLHLPPDLAPGSYRLVVGLYERQSGERLPLVTAEGEPLPDGVLPLPFVIEVP